ncbi:MAG: glycosyltransferase family 1 protein [Proteobacteria bacterium]|nr:glycosyltransferase family 1 protein [Pseudomonadota bacterium]
MTNWPRRVAIVSDAWHPQVNGVVRSLGQLVREMRGQGIEVELFGPDRFATLPCPFYPEIRLALWPKRRLHRMLREFKPDALHIATEGPLGLSARRWAMRQRYAFTTSFHTRFPEYLAARLPLPRALTERVVYRWMRGFHGAASAVMAATPSLIGELRGRGFANVCLWTRGVDTKGFHPGLRGEPGGTARPVFLYAGRLAVEKNIEAFLELDLPGSKLVVGDGPDRAGLERRFPQVRFAGMLSGEALTRAYASADVLVFPSRTDTFGLVMLEALACGTPVAAYPVMGPRDILGAASPPVGGLDEDLQAAALAALQVDRSLCRRFAEGFSWSAATKMFLGNLVPMAGRRGIATRRNYRNARIPSGLRA